ncbi:cation:proton antiporter [Sedimenticola selenatireducens]|uniref:Sodium:proton antiporter n=1 Tax=Sedimenticola selenatireducens TaxID=191960 RepID=A0A2N6D174_9GAMM|nr:cation:proton antiporter [Sedimenticola selenatireducens]PLX63438.1 MAG: sodium:proton antiporter [Sedimenticola selenatireducens]
MTEHPILFTIFLIFSGAAVFATLALYARQALLISYILLGVLLGPSAAGLVNDSELVREMSNIGIMFLLFLMGLELNPRELLLLLKKTTTVTLLSSALFAFCGGLVAWLFGFTLQESLIVGAAMMFSSTIIGLKLLPTTVLHHQHTGELVISILLFQDLIAILLLLAMKGGSGNESPLLEIFKLGLALPLLIGVSALFVKFVFYPLMKKFDTIKEYIFLITIGWCLGLAEAATALGLSHEIGAFIAGISLATSPVSFFISENLKPLRDFFLVLFFFSLGAGFDLHMLDDVILPALLIAAAMLLLKPVVFSRLLRSVGEEKMRATEVGARLGQLSEFSLLLAVLAWESELIGLEASYLIQLATLLTFLVSTYRVLFKYPTPIALSAKLRRD